MLSGLCSAIAAIIYTARLETGTPVLGQRILLDVVGAAVIGGVSLFGGKGKVIWRLLRRAVPHRRRQGPAAARPVARPRSSRSRAASSSSPPSPTRSATACRAGLTMAETLLRIAEPRKSFFGVPGAARRRLRAAGRPGARPRRRERLRQVDDHEHPGRRPPARPGPHELDGAGLRAARRRAMPQARGIAFIHQELNLFQNLSIEENLFIERLPRSWSPACRSSTGARCASARKAAAGADRSRRLAGHAGQPPAARASGSWSRSPRRWARDARLDHLRRADDVADRAREPNACSASSSACATRASRSSTSAISSAT